MKMTNKPNYLFITTLCTIFGYFLFIPLVGGPGQSPLAGNKAGIPDGVAGFEIQPPVGTVMAFPGAWPPRKLGGKQWTEEELGWALCDGRLFDAKKFPALAAVLTDKKLPDFRGYFLRGLDDSPKRGAAKRDKQANREIGSHQDFSTARPNNAFKTNETGNHHHGDGHFNLLLQFAPHSPNKNTATVRGGDYNANEPALTEAKTMKEKGQHFHTIDEGGDPETRPINKAVYWIIRTR